MKQSFAIALLIFFSNAFLKAQPFTLNPKIKPAEIKLVPYPAKTAMEKGQYGLFEVNQTADTMYYFVKAVSILSPVMISVTSKQKTNKLSVSLHKDFWSKAENSGTTGADGNWTATFKTGGDIGIRIATEKKTEYSLLIWVGEEIYPSMQIPFKKYPAKKN